MRCVLDTNVLLAGLATHGLCEALLLLCVAEHTVITSEHILSEVAEHFAGKFRATSEQVHQVITTLRAQCEIITPVDIPAVDFADADDRPVLGTAVAAKADCLVTGDKELLALGSYRAIPILTPRACYDELRGER